VPVAAWEFLFLNPYQLILPSWRVIMRHDFAMYISNIINELGYLERQRGLDKIFVARRWKPRKGMPLRCAENGKCTEAIGMDKFDVWVRRRSTACGLSALQTTICRRMSMDAMPK
jgi:hypothetical protein